MEDDELPASLLRRFGNRLRHDTPRWVGANGIFHVRLRVTHEQPACLTTPPLADALLESARFYQDRCR